MLRGLILDDVFLLVTIFIATNFFLLNTFTHFIKTNASMLAFVISVLITGNMVVSIIYGNDIWAKILWLQGQFFIGVFAVMIIFRRIFR
jgi:hypothetical protein